MLLIQIEGSNGNHTFVLAGLEHENAGVAAFGESPGDHTP
jgi:hypothetical protein